MAWSIIFEGGGEKWLPRLGSCGWAGFDGGDIRGEVDEVDMVRWRGSIFDFFASGIALSASSVALRLICEADDCSGLFADMESLSWLG